MQEVLTAGNATYTELKNLIIWAKDNGGMGTFYRSRHELVFAFKNSTAAHINSFELGQNGRYRTNVWQYRGVNSLHAGRMDELALHPTVNLLNLAFLAPDIIESIIAGKQPAELSVNGLTKRVQLPIEWMEQRRILGFPQSQR